MSAVQDQILEREVPAHPASLWRNVDFILLWWGQVVSTVGTQVSQLAFPLLVLAVTGSPAQTGLLTAVRSLPYIILTLPAGALIDRWDRKRVMIVSDTGRVLALGSIPLALATGHLTFAQLAVASFVEGTLFTFFNLAESACLPQVVGKEHLPRAVALSTAADHTSGLIGPSLGGILFALGRGVPFLTDAISYLISVISLLFIKVKFQEERAEPAGRLGAEIKEGLLWLWRNPLMRFLAVLIGGLNLFSMGYPLIVIVRAQELHASAVVIGLLFATGGIGGILGSLVTPSIQRHFTFGHIMIACAWIWAVTWLPYAWAPNLALFGVANAIGFLILPITMITQFSYRLTVIPDELQGRVNSVFKLVAFGSQPLALALAGVLLQWYGAVEAILILMTPQIALAAIATFYTPLLHAPALTEYVEEA